MNNQNTFFYFLEYCFFFTAIVKKIICKKYFEAQNTQKSQPLLFIEFWLCVNISNYFCTFYISFLNIPLEFPIKNEIRVSYIQLLKLSLPRIFVEALLDMRCTLTISYFYHVFPVYRHNSANEGESCKLYFSSFSLHIFLSIRFHPAN